MAGLLAGPPALAAVIEEFAYSDRDVAYWRAMPDVDEPWGTGDCGWLSLRFARRCDEHGLGAWIWAYRAAPDCPDPLQGSHATTAVQVNGVTYGVDWTARQFHDLTPDVPPCPFIYEGPRYPELEGVKFLAPAPVTPSVWHQRLLDNGPLWLD